MDKKGAEIATSTIVMILIGLVVLVVVILLFRQQATAGAKGYGEFQKQTSPDALKKCNNIILGRFCAEGSSCPEGSTSVPGVWPDCNTVCCER
ncbi:hypothetical protein D6825_01370 [Candidatus Woesearchaeota archaeon]|nr:MAG: hypothetical protein D6825_01370 [Candidatus Woesearchaeota archaeon]